MNRAARILMWVLVMWMGFELPCCATARSIAAASLGAGVYEARVVVPAWASPVSAFRRRPA